MKILLDANLSYRIVARVKSVYPDISHVSLEGLAMHTPDILIWRWAKKNGYAVVVTNDEDFPSILAQLGPPPKVIHLKLENQPNKVYVNFLIEKYDAIKAFLEDGTEELLEFTLK